MVKSVDCKYGMSALILSLKEAEIKSGAIPVNMHQGQTATPVMVHAGQINETTTLCLPTEEYWRQATLEGHGLGYINNILSGMQETPIEPKELRNKGYIKPFQQESMEFNNGFILYYDNPRTVGLSQLRLRVVPFKFIRVVMSECHVYPLAGHSHDQKIIFMILA